MNKVIYYKQKLIDSFEFSEIDFDLYDFIGFDYEKHDDHVEICRDAGKAEGFPINIDRMITKLQEMREKGATHVSLEYHCDHIGYLIDGWDISIAPDEEVKSFKESLKEKKKESIKQKKARLKRELDALENSYED